MKQNKQKILLITIFTFLSFILSLTMIGCGGGGGGNGRQVLPGENPAGPVINTGTGTGGGGGGGGTASNTPIITPAEKITEAWKNIDYGNYGGAIIYFDQVLSDTSATTKERQQAYNGRGWARAKQYDTLSGMSDFLQGGDLLESRLGYALALIQKGQLAGISDAIGILEDIGLGDIHYTLTLEHQQIGVTSAEAHAMLAYAYFWRGNTGDDDKARAQILEARRVDSSETSSVAQIYATLKKAGLTGI